MSPLVWCHDIVLQTLMVGHWQANRMGPDAPDELATMVERALDHCKQHGLPYEDATGLVQASMTPELSQAIAEQTEAAFRKGKDPAWLSELPVAKRSLLRRSKRLRDHICHPTTEAVRRGVYRSVDQVTEELLDWIKELHQRS